MTTTTLQQNLKKYFYSGIGLASHTAEIVQKSVDEFVKQGKEHESDGKKIVNDALQKFMYRSESEVSKLQKKIKQLEKKTPAKRNGTAISAKTVVKQAQKITSKNKRKAVKPKKAFA